jgi:hypothetical protein
LTLSSSQPLFCPPQSAHTNILEASQTQRSWFCLRTLALPDFLVWNTQRHFPSFRWAWLLTTGLLSLKPLSSVVSSLPYSFPLLCGKVLTGMCFLVTCHSRMKTS